MPLVTVSSPKGINFNPEGRWKAPPDANQPIMYGLASMSPFGVGTAKRRGDSCCLTLSWSKVYCRTADLDPNPLPEILKELQNCMALGNVLMASRRMDCATKAYLRGVELVPYGLSTEPRVRSLLAQMATQLSAAYLALERHSEALLQAALGNEYVKNNPLTLFRLGQAFSRLRNYKKAKAYFMSAKRLSHVGSELTREVVREVTLIDDTSLVARSKRHRVSSAVSPDVFPHKHPRISYDDEPDAFLVERELRRQNTNWFLLSEFLHHNMSVLQALVGFVAGFIFCFLFRR